MYESGTRLQERITNLASRPRRRRTAQRNRSSSEPQRHRPRPSRAWSPVPFRARRRHRPHAQRHPRRSSASWPLPAWSIEGRAVRLGTPGRPSPLVRLNPDGAAVLSLEILVDSIAVAIVGLGGEVARADPRRPAAGSSSRSTMSSPTSRPSSPTCRSATTGPIVGIGVAVAGVVRRSDGMVSMAPNLGWVDVPLGARLARALSTALPIAVLNDADAGVARRGAARRGRRRRQRAVRVRRGRRRRRPHRRRAPADRCGRLRAARSATSRSTRAARRAAAGRSAAGRRRSARAMLLAPGRLSRRRGPGRRSTPSCARPKPGPSRRLRALAHVGRWLGIGLGRPREHPQPAAGRSSAARTPAFTRSSAARSRPSSAGTRSRRPARLVRVVPAAARGRRAARRRGRDGVRAAALRSGGLVRPRQPRRFTWRAPDVGARIRSNDGIDRRPKRRQA